MRLPTRSLLLLALMTAGSGLSGCESTGNNSASNVDRTGPGAPIYTQGEQIDADFYNSVN